jgi:hypothetical protein
MTDKNEDTSAKSLFDEDESSGIEKNLLNKQTEMVLTSTPNLARRAMSRKKRIASDQKSSPSFKFTYISIIHLLFLLLL